MKLPSGLYDDSTLTRAVYSRAACIYRKMPEAVAFPVTREDFVAAVCHALEKGTPVTPRGGGSGLAGQSVGGGLVIDHSRFLDSIEITASGETVVEPGVVLSKLNRVLSERGIFFPPDPSSQDFCTIGGMIANNSKGARSVKYGGTLQWLNWVEVLLSDGSVVRVGKEELEPEAFPSGMLARAAELIDSNRDRIIAGWPRSKANTSGYNLRDCLGSGRKINLLPLFAGSEGTLGIFLKASLRSKPCPGARSLAIAEFSNAEEAAAATLEIVPRGPSACELLDRTFIDIVRKGEGRFPVPVSDRCGSILIIEADGATDEEAAGSLENILKNVSSAGKFLIAGDESQKSRIWSFRKAASPLLNRGRGRLKSVRFIEDGAVPTENIPSYVEGVTGILSGEGIETVIFGHSGDGNFHVNPFMDLTDRRHFELVPVIAEQTARLISSLGGALAGEHGDGRLRTPYLRIVYGDLVDLFIQIKKTLDPDCLFNPGIIAAEEPAPITEGLRFSPSYRRIPLAGELSREKWSFETERCHGCGTCRDFCPTAKATSYDPLTSRGRAHLLQSVLDGSLKEKELYSNAVLDIFDSCLSCSECAVNCPTGVDISPISSLVLNAYSGRLRKLRNSFYSGLSSIPYKSPRALMKISGKVMNSRLARAVNEKITGLRSDIRLTFPDGGFAFDPARSYEFGAGGGKEILLFYGCYGNVYDREGETLSAIGILEKLGIGVIVPPQACCGISRMSKGLFGTAAEDVRFTQENFIPRLREGMPIVFTSPSCALAVMKDHPSFFPSEASEKMAASSVYISDYLVSVLHGTGARPGALRGSFVYQTPCHAAAIGADEKDIELLSLIPGMEFRGKTSSCCGMGGTYGLRKENSRISDSLGRTLAGELASTPADFIISPCGSCRIMVSNLTAKKAVHPLELLAAAMGVVGLGGSREPMTSGGQ